MGMLTYAQITEDITFDERKMQLRSLKDDLPKGYLKSFLSANPSFDTKHGRKTIRRFWQAKEQNHYLQSEFESIAHEYQEAQRAKSSAKLNRLKLAIVACKARLAKKKK